MAFTGGKQNQTAGKKLFEIFILIGLLVYVSFWSLPGLIEQYSFWRDEIFTAAFISGSWVEMFRDWIGPDVHPPFYFIVTKVWSSFLGTSELSLRGFSFLCALGTVALLWRNWQRNKRPQRLIALLFVTSSPTFLYYSQEARSYTLVLIFSCWLLLRVLSHRDEQSSNNFQATQNPCITYGLCITLSLTHYFGFILSFFILALDCWDKSICRNRYASVLVIVIICLWPAFHIGFLGNLGGVQQEKLSNLTTTFTPLVSTFEAYVYSCLYFIHSGIKTLNILMISILATVITRYYFMQKNKGKSPTKSQRDFNYAAILIGLILSFLAIVELFWPITTARNLIILLYPTAIAIGTVFETTISELSLKNVGHKIIGAGSLAALTIILLLSSKISVNNLNLKVNHGVDYKSLAFYLTANNLCDRGCLTLDYDPEGNNFGDRIDDYYFGKLNLVSYKRIDQLDPQISTSLPIVGSSKDQSEIEELGKMLQNKILITSCSDDLRADERRPFIFVEKSDKIKNQPMLCIKK